MCAVAAILGPRLDAFEASGYPLALSCAPMEDRNELTAPNFPSAKEDAEAVTPPSLYEGPNSSYRLAFTDEPTKWIKSAEKEGKNNNLTYSGGFVVGNDGKITSVLWDSAAFNAGLSIGSEVVAVNGRKFDADGLKRAIKAAAGKSASPELLIHDGEVYRTVKLDWHGGLRYPRLVKSGGGEGTLDRLLTPR